jgi:Domain of unknown function (DUF1998)
MPQKDRILRRSSSISPFGIGAMVNFPDGEVLMTAAVDKWPLPKFRDAGKFGLVIRDNRLEARLRVSHFRLPPAEATPEQEAAGYFGGIPFVRFPAWYYCPKCGMMKRLSGNNDYPPKCTAPNGSTCSRIPIKKRPTLIPSRFVAVCDKGHIQDFPYDQWVHQDSDCHESQLRIWSSASSATITGAIVECVVCNKKKNLMSALGGGNTEEDSATYLKCSAGKPWEGLTIRDGDCGNTLKIMNRGASSVYFPIVIGSIYIPSANQALDPLHDYLKEHLFSSEEDWQNCLLDEGKRLNEEKIKEWAYFKRERIPNFDLSRITRLAEAFLNGLQDSPDDCGEDKEEHYRSYEYEALKRGATLPDETGIDALSLAKADLNKYKNIVTQNFDTAVLVNKLRETRALVGFSRGRPAEGNWQDKSVQRITHKKNKWCPAIASQGEGIFLELNHKKLQKWASQTAVVTRIESLKSRHNHARREKNPEAAERNITPEYVLIHTLAHVLINQFVFECGYGSSSLRERLYCNLSDTGNPMYGVLIYTASGDSEGTLGGLVRQGREGYLENTLFNAIEKAKWCSSDPICIELDAQGPDGSNLAACHSCCLLPETSCETGNRLLDRALLIGTLKDPSIGFFTFEA